MDLKSDSMLNKINPPSYKNALIIGSITLIGGVIIHIINLNIQMIKVHSSYKEQTLELEQLLEQNKLLKQELQILKNSNDKSENNQPYWETIEQYQISVDEGWTTLKSESLV